jgi:hypothetical protein
MKRTTTRVMKHNLILQGEMSPTHRSKSCMRDQKVSPINCPKILGFPRSMCPSPFSCAPPSSRKSQDEISFRGGGAVTPCVMVFLITFIKVLIKNQIYWLIQFQIAKVKIQIKFSKQVDRLTNCNSKLLLWVDQPSMCKQELLVQISSILGNSIKFYWISNPRASLIFLIQIIPQILKHSNNGSCSFFQNLQIHILFEIFFQVDKAIFCSNQFKSIWILYE